MKMKKLLAIAAALVLAFLVSPIASAQDGDSIDAATLDKFVVAFADVRDLQREFAARLDGVSDQGEAQALQQEVQEKMVRAVEEAGLSVPEYNGVVAAMEQDEALRDEILNQVE